MDAIPPKTRDEYEFNEHDDNDDFDKDAREPGKEEDDTHKNAGAENDDDPQAKARDEDKQRQKYLEARQKQTSMIHALIMDAASEGAKTARRCFNNAKVWMVKPRGLYQNEGVEFMLVHEHMVKELGNEAPGGICADSIGLGKTYMSARLTLGDYRPDQVCMGVTPVSKKTLIVAPNWVTREWSEQFNKLIRSAHGHNANLPSVDDMTRAGFAKSAAKIIDNMNRQQIMYVGGRGFVMEVDNSTKFILSVPETVGVVVCSMTLFTQSRKADDMYTNEDGVPKFITDTHWHRLIVDEGHKGKNTKTETHKALLRIKATNKWILTATPVHNKAKELKALAAIIGVPSSVQPRAVKEKYMMQRIQKFEEELMNKDKPDAVLVDMKCHVEDVPLTRYEAHVYNIVQEMAEEADNNDRMAFYTFLRQCSTDHRVYLSGAIDRAIAAAKESGTYESRDAIIKQVLDDHDIYSVLKFDPVKVQSPSQAWDVIMAKSSTKMKRLVAHLHRIHMRNMETDDKHAREKSIVFCEYITEIECLYAALEKLNINVVKVVGGRGKDERCANFHNFKMRSDFKEFDTNVLILQSSCGSEGLNLQCANNVFFMTPTWNPCREMQAIGRCYRSGQEKCVNVVRFVTHMMMDDKSRRDCMDQRCLLVQDRKKTMVKSLLNDDSIERYLGKIKLTDDEVNFIISGLERDRTHNNASKKQDREDQGDSTKSSKRPRCDANDKAMTLSRLQCDLNGDDRDSFAGLGTVLRRLYCL